MLDPKGSPLSISKGRRECNSIIETRQLDCNRALKLYSSTYRGLLEAFPSLKNSREEMEQDVNLLRHLEITESHTSFNGQCIDFFRSFDFYNVSDSAIYWCVNSSMAGNYDRGGRKNILKLSVDNMLRIITCLILLKTKEWNMIADTLSIPIKNVLGLGRKYQTDVEIPLRLFPNECNCNLQLEEDIHTCRKVFTQVFIMFESGPRSNECLVFNFPYFEIFDADFGDLSQ